MDEVLSDPDKLCLAEPVEPIDSFDFIAAGSEPDPGAVTARCLRDRNHGPRHGVAVTLVFEAQSGVANQWAIKAR